MAMARLFCGAWGTRDFNNVHPIAEHCNLPLFQNILAGMAGPATNYLTMWLGTVLIRTAKTSKGLAWGLTLIFASFPFARLFTVLIGGGDETGIAKSLIANPTLARLAAITVVLSIISFPLYTAFKALFVKRQKGWYFLGFLLVPMLLEGAVVLLFLNHLLELGVLTQPSLMGAPSLVFLVLVFATAVFAASAGFIKTLVGETDGLQLSARLAE